MSWMISRSNKCQYLGKGFPPLFLFFLYEIETVLPPKYLEYFINLISNLLSKNYYIVIEQTVALEPPLTPLALTTCKYTGTGSGHSSESMPDWQYLQQISQDLLTQLKFCRNTPLQTRIKSRFPASFRQIDAAPTRSVLASQATIALQADRQPSDEIYTLKL